MALEARGYQPPQESEAAKAAKEALELSGNTLEGVETLADSDLEEQVDLDLGPAPEGPISGELGALDDALEAKAFSDALERTVEKAEGVTRLESADLEEQVDLDQSAAPEGPIAGDLGELDKQMEIDAARKAVEDAIDLTDEAVMEEDEKPAAESDDDLPMAA